MAVNVTHTRYKDTPVIPDPGDGKGDRHGLWVPPEEFENVAAEDMQLETAASAGGFLDEVAFRAYGSGYERYWWVIARAQGIIDPEREVPAGAILRVPPRGAATTFEQRRD